MTTLAKAAQKQWKLKRLDVKTTFFNGILKEVAYIEILDGFKELGAEGKVAKLKQLSTD